MKLSNMRGLWFPTIIIIAIIMVCYISIYIDYGPHIIYQDTIVIKHIFWEDGDLCLFSQQGNVYGFDNTNNLTWKKMLDMRVNDTLHITVRQGVLGDKVIISIRDE
jgi:hypothetical protein